MSSYILVSNILMQKGIILRGKAIPSYGLEGSMQYVYLETKGTLQVRSYLFSTISRVFSIIWMPFEAPRSGDVVSSLDFCLCSTTFLMLNHCIQHAEGRGAQVATNV